MQLNEPRQANELRTGSSFAPGQANRATSSGPDRVSGRELQRGPKVAGLILGWDNDLASKRP